MLELLINGVIISYPSERTKTNVREELIYEETFVS